MLGLLFMRSTVCWIHESLSSFCFSLFSRFSVSA